MAENEPNPPQHKAAPKAAATTTTTEEPEEVEIDENYVGVDPIYANSAYEEPLNPEAPSGRGADKDEADAVTAEQEMIERVKANEAACAVEVDELEPYEEWVSSSYDAARKATVVGVDQERVEADREATEEAKDDYGKIPPRSTSRHQPGVNTVS